MAMVCDRCGETFTLKEWNKINRKIEVRPIIGGEEGWGVIGNKKLKVTFELSADKEQSDE